jgi:hypothetical protein
LCGNPVGLSHKSVKNREFLNEICGFLPVLSGCCSETEVSKQLYYQKTAVRIAVLR